jgi:hypothetical protein
MNPLAGEERLKLEVLSFLAPSNEVRFLDAPCLERITSS